MISLLILGKANQRGKSAIKKMQKNLCLVFQPSVVLEASSSGSGQCVSWVGAIGQAQLCCSVHLGALQEYFLF